MCTWGKASHGQQEHWAACLDGTHTLLFPCCLVHVAAVLGPSPPFSQEQGLGPPGNMVQK